MSTKADIKTQIGKKKKKERNWGLVSLKFRIDVLVTFNLHRSECLFR